MAYSNEITKQAARFALNPRDVLFCQLIAAGAEKGDAYQGIYEHQANRKTTPETATMKANDHIKNNPALSVLIRQFKHQRPGAKKMEEEPTQAKQYDATQYTTREGIVRKIMDATEGLTGKDELQGLLTLAKIQGLDQPQEQEREDLRRFFVAFKSDCRRCKLMELFRSVKSPKTG